MDAKHMIKKANPLLQLLGLGGPGPAAAAPPAPTGSMPPAAFGAAMAAAPPAAPGAGAARAVDAANAARPATAPPPPQPVTVPGARAAAPAGMPKLDIQAPAGPAAPGPATPNQPGDSALAQPIPARKSIHDLPNNPEMERRWAADQAKVDARARLATSRANFGKVPSKTKPAIAAPAATPPTAGPAAPALAGMGKGAAFGAKMAGATAVPVRKPISRTTKTGKPTVDKWSPGHQFQGAKMQKVAAGDSILDTVLSNPATPYVAGAGLGAAGGLGLHELIAALRDRYTGQAEPPAERSLGRMGAMGAGTGLGLLTAARGMGKLGSAEAEFGTKLAAMDEGMAAGARSVKVRNVKPVTRNEWTGSHKDMTKRLAEACS